MRLILNGGGCGEQIKDSYEVFAKEVDGGKILYIPLAWNNGNMQDCINWFREQMSPYGITNIEQILDANEITKQKLSEVKGVFIGGGNTYQLLKALKDSCAFENLYEFALKDGLIMGGSAGALIFGENIDTCKKDELEIKSCNDENFVKLKDTKGFNFIHGYSILPHYNKKPEQYENTQKRIKKLLDKGNKVIGLPEETSLYIKGKTVVVIGQKPAVIFNGQRVETIVNGGKIADHVQQTYSKL